MITFSNRSNKAFRALFLLLAIGALIGVFYGVYFHIFSCLAFVSVYVFSAPKRKTKNRPVKSYMKESYFLKPNVARQ